MATLCISVTFLDGRFHGSKKDAPEWPPSPWRLFQALLASAAGNHLEKPDCFRFLEKLPPRTILAPRADTGQTRTAFVLNNQSDVPLAPEKLRRPKVFTPMLLKDARWTVHYLWDNVRADQEEAHQAMGYARMLHALGLGIDLVVGNGRMLSTAEAAALKSEYPDECSRCRHLDLCRGGCPKDRLSAGGNRFGGKSRLCEGLLLFLDHARPALEKLADKVRAERRAVTGPVADKPVAAAWAQAGRNDPCPCGSGRKYKHCCMP